MSQKESKLRFTKDEWADSNATAEIQHPAAVSVPASSSSLLLSPDVQSHTSIGAQLGSNVPFVEPREGIGLPSPLLASSGSVFLDTPPQRPISSVGLATSRLHDHGFGGLAGFDRFGGTSSSNVTGASTTNSGFSGELLGYNSWLKSLNFNEQIVAVDLLLSDLNADVLAYVEGKFSSNSNNIGTSSLHSQPQQQSHQQQQQQQLNWDTRPHSAGPLQQSYQMFSPVADPSYLHRRALQLQLQNDPTHGHYGHPSSGHTMNFDDLNNQNVLKMNALNTITSRSSSDLKKTSPPLHSDDGQARGRLHQRQQPSHGVSASVPAAPRPISAVTANGTTMTQSSSAVVSPVSSDEDIKKTESLLKLASLNSVNRPQAPPAPPKSPMPPDITTLQLLNNIPAWLKALRLHKYTEILKHLSWKDMVNLDDSDLAQLGVATVGARRKLLKAFALVRECQLSGEIA